ncbi:MAG: S9 family peptidase [Robiginitomaculum sp.]|nr:S9 family peptidase [Robiginitomaculum sp.]
MRKVFPMGKWPQITPPKARKSPVLHHRHGQSFTDNYHWLRDNNWPEVVRNPKTLSTEIREHLLTENNYTEKMLAGTTILVQQLVDEMKGRMTDKLQQVPARDGNWFYNSKYLSGSEHPQFVRYPALNDQKADLNNEQILLDCNSRSKESEFYQLGEFTHSPDHSKIAWSEDVKGSEFFEIFTCDLATSEISSTGICTASDDLVWLSDSSSLLWIWRDENSRPKQVRLHILGTDPATDQVLYTEDDNGFFLGLDQTSDHKYALINCNDHQTSEIWTIDLAPTKTKPNCLWPRRIAIEASADHLDGKFTLLTNDDDAKDFQVIRISASDPCRDKQETLVPHNPGILILGQQQFSKFHVRIERENALPRIIIRQEENGTEQHLKFDDAAYALGLEGGFEFDTDILRFAISSPSRPQEIYDYNMRSHSRKILQQQQIPSGHNTDDYEVKRIYAPANDGQMIPVTLLSRRDAQPDTAKPVLLYGYGAYGYSIPASFSSNRLSLVDRGFVFAIAHIRGGKEKGFSWYEKGRREHKKNSFTDFINVAEHLIDQGITQQGKIIAQGGSAGGLLMGAVANLRPDLFAGFIAQVPFVDVLNTMSDETLPLTPPEWPEWGNPVASFSDYQTIANYCPITNVSDLDYPPILATAGLCDTRVTWWEPAKWIAALRDKAPKGGPYLLKTEMSAGHGGASGRYAGLQEIAEAQAFSLHVVKEQPNSTQL